MKNPYTSKYIEIFHLYFILRELFLGQNISKNLI